MKVDILLPKRDALISTGREVGPMMDPSTYCQEEDNNSASCRKFTNFLESWGDS